MIFLDISCSLRVLETRLRMKKCRNLEKVVKKRCESGKAYYYFRSPMGKVLLDSIRKQSGRLPPSKPSARDLGSIANTSTADTICNKEYE